MRQTFSKQFLILKGITSLLGFFFISPCYAISHQTPLTLSEAVHLAIAKEPELQALEANAEALKQQAIADGQLPDPQLVLGALNVPTNTFSFNQDDMTMEQVGLQQTFPAGHSLAIKRCQTQTLALAEQRQRQAKMLLLKKNVRETWLDLYYWQHSQTFINENCVLFKQLLSTIRAQYSNGKGSLSDVLQVQVELTRLQDQSLQIKQQIALLQTQLGRWIGQRQALRPLATREPHEFRLPSLNSLQVQLDQHPLLKADAANVLASREGVSLAKQQYFPSFTVGVDYGFRQGKFMDGDRRPDLLTAQVTMDLPLFTHQRQDRHVRASAYQLESKELLQQMDYRDLKKALMGQYAVWQDLKKRESLYQAHLLPEAKQNAKAALLAYQNNTVDLTTVLRAYMNVLQIEREQLQVQIEYLKEQAAILYLSGR